MSKDLPDTSVWIALALADHIHNSMARNWFEAVTEGALFCRSTQQSFLRLLTSASVLAPYGNPPLTNSEAWSGYEALLRDDRVGFAEEPSGCEATWRALSARSTVSPKLWMDAYLAAFARASGYRMVTTDAAFRQFEGLELLLLG